MENSEPEAKAFFYSDGESLNKHSQIFQSEPVSTKIDDSEIVRAFEKAQQAKLDQARYNTRRGAVVCPDGSCSMYLMLSQSKLNVFVSLLGLVLLST